MEKATHEKINVS